MLKADVAALDAPELAALDQPTDEKRTTDLGFARLFVEQHGAHIRHTGPLGWFEYTGKHWAADETSAVYRRMAKTADTIWADFPRVREDRRRAWLKFAERAESAAGQAAALKLASTRHPIAVRAADFDRDPMLLNVDNGTVDLRTGRLRKHRPDDLLTKIVPVAYDPQADAPRWRAFLNVIFPDRPDLIAYVQRALGYSITGDVSMHVLFLSIGGGRNGKSTLINTVQDVVGTYARTADPELLLVQRGEVHPTRLADLHGARFVPSIEVEDGRRLAEAFVKWLTGGDVIKARRMHRDFFEFEPTHHIWMAANHKPGIRGVDVGIWSRIHLIPFTVHLPSALGDAYDEHFRDKLREEYPGILRWLVDGCLAWQREGLNPPDEVVAATAAYRAEMDAMGRFIADRCTTEPDAKTPAAALYGAYKQWVDEVGEYRQPQMKFNEYLTQRGFTEHRSSSGKYWKGIRRADEGV